MCEQLFSILIPTWNNLPYLKLCIESVRKHSIAPHQILVHVNQGLDETIPWLEAQGIEYTYSSDNVGICVAVNQAFQLATHDYILYMNDDMYVLPGWDESLNTAIKSLESNSFFLSSTMIEPHSSGNSCVIVADYGDDLDSFREHDLLAEFRSLPKTDWQGSTWPPCVMHRTLWERVGGFSEEFSPGLYSDPDLSMKLWKIGCRTFWGVAASRVYHFGSKSTSRVAGNNGRKLFTRKWGILPSVFTEYYLRRGSRYDGPLKNPNPDFKFYFKKLQAFCMSLFD